MNRGRARNAGGGFSAARGRSSRFPDSSDRRSHGGGDSSNTNSSYGTGRNFQSRGRSPQGSYTNHYEPKQALDSTEQQTWSARGRKETFSQINRPRPGQTSAEFWSSNLEKSTLSTPSGASYEQALSSSSSSSSSSHQFNSEDLQSVQIGQTSGEGPGGSETLDTGNSDLALKFDVSCEQRETPLASKSNIKNEASPVKTATNNKSNYKAIEDEKLSAVHDPFDICLPKVGAGITLKPSLLVKNRERRNDVKRSTEGQNGMILGSGLILLKNFISLGDQAKVVKKCRELGLGSGGFYQPAYRDGAKLHLKMMCLGKNWDPETSTYGESRPIDNAKPPSIPVEFDQLVEKAMNDSYNLIKNNSQSGKIESILPRMSPNICIVNYYAENGRLGLHQDRDESSESLQRNIPVVSFSIGDSADFLYGKQRDIDKAKKVVLESGDVLIFGGLSRHIFHGVAAIHSKTAPNTLLDETNLRPGRLNLTFRQY